MHTGSDERTADNGAGKQKEGVKRVSLIHLRLRGYLGGGYHLAEESKGGRGGGFFCVPSISVVIMRKHR